MRIFLVFTLLCALSYSMRIPEIPENFEADYRMTQPFPTSGRYWRSWTNQIERFDTTFFGMTATTMNYHRCLLEFQSPGCQQSELTAQMYSLQLPPWAEYRGNETLNGRSVEHWFFNVSFINADFELWVGTNSMGQVVPARQRFVFREMLTFTIDIEYTNVVPGEIAERYLLLPNCQNAPQAIDRCNNRLFPTPTEEQFVFLLDISGSMNDQVTWQGRRASRISILQEQFAETARGFNPRQNFDVTVFSSTSSSLWRGVTQPANSTNIQAAINYVNSLRAGGGTNLLSALRPLMQDGIQAIYLLSDGEPNESPQSILDFVRQRNSELRAPIRIHTTAFDAGVIATKFMRNLADLTGGIFTDINQRNQ